MYTKLGTTCIITLCFIGVYSQLLRPGSILGLKGQALLIEGHMDVLLKLNLPANTSEIMQTLEANLLQLNATIFKLHRALGNKDALLQMMRNKFFSVWDQLRLTKAGKADSRKKRGLLDIGGKLFSYLFGMATTDDIKATNRQLQTYAAEIMNTKHFVTKLEAQVQNNHEMILSIESNQDKIFKLVVGINDRIKVIEAMAIIGSQLDTIRDTLQQMHHINLLYHIAMDEVRGGSTPSFLIDIGILKALEEKAIEELSLNPVVSIKEEPVEIYLRTARTIPGPNHVSFILILPFSSGNRYNFFQFFPFPSRHVNNTRWMVDIRETHLLSAVDMNSYAIVPDSVSHFCTKRYIPAPLYLCPPMVPIYDTYRASCHLQLLLQQAPTLCKFTEVQEDGPIAVSVNGSWFVSTTGPMQVTITCGDTPRFLTIEKSVAIPYPCSLNSRNMSLWSQRMLHFNVDREFAVRYLELDVKLAGNTSQVIEKSLTHKKDNFTKAILEAGVVPAIVDYHKWEISGTVVIIVIAIIFLVKMRYLKNKISDKLGSCLIDRIRKRLRTKQNTQDIVLPMETEARGGVLNEGYIAQTVSPAPSNQTLGMYVMRDQCQHPQVITRGSETICHNGATS